MKQFILLFSLLFLLTGCSLAVKQERDVVPDLKQVYYYLPVDKSSFVFNEKLVPAGSLVVGCNDYLTLRKGDQVVAENTKQFLTSALEQLFRLSVPENSFYYNPLVTNSFIELESIEEDEDGMAVIKINGDLVSSGSCEDVRIKGMIQETVRQYYRPEKYVIELNGSEANWRCLFDESGLCQ